MDQRKPPIVCDVNDCLIESETVVSFLRIHIPTRKHLLVKVYIGKAGILIPVYTYGRRTEHFNNQAEWRRALGIIEHLYYTIASAYVPVLLELDWFGLGPQDFSEAENNLMEAIDIGSRANVLGPAALPQCLMGRLRTRQNQIEDGQRWIAECDLVLSRLPNYTGEREMLKAKGELALAMGRLEESQAMFTTLAELTAQTGQKWKHARALLYLAEAHKRHGAPGAQVLAERLYRESSDGFAKTGSSGYIELVRGQMES